LAIVSRDPPVLIAREQLSGRVPARRFCLAASLGYKLTPGVLSRDSISLMFEHIHRFGSRIRHSRLLEKQQWLWDVVEPAWQYIFQKASASSGYPTLVNNDVFRLTYEYGSRYDRHDRHGYEPVVYKALVNSIEEGMTICDIGAHVGLLTLAAAKRVGPTGRVFAFEPAPDSLAILRNHIRFNRYEDRGEAIESVVSDTDGTVSFYIYKDSMSASLGRNNLDELSPQRRSDPLLKAVEVKTRSLTLDQFCKDRGVEPDVLKIDVEGSELLVLRGARDLMRRKPLIVLCEIHPKQMENCSSSLVQFNAFIQGIGYTIETLDSPNPEGIFHSRIRPA
jgi:FkbM family methyltransferase